MDKYINVEGISFFKALSSETRMNILDLLVDGEKNIQELSVLLNMSSAVISKHITILETENIINVRRVSGKRGVQRVCNLIFRDYSLRFTSSNQNHLISQEYELPIGNYSAYDIKPTCGLATVMELLGDCDDSRYFSHLDKENIGILWFAEGWIEYKLPSYLFKPKLLSKIEFTLEISSESPKFNADYKSDIYFYLNGTQLGRYTTSGDFGDTKGAYTPDWWILSQYGEIVTISITKRGTFMGRLKVSDIGLADIKWQTDQDNTLRIWSPLETEHAGGLNLFGKGFGNSNSHIVFKTYHHL